MTTKETPNKITAVLKVTATAEFFGDEASEETLRYCIEQDLEDAGFEVDVSLLKEQEPIEPKIRHGNWWFQCGKCKAIIEYGDKFCKECGQEAKWK